MTRAKRKLKKLAPWVPPPDAPPIREVLKKLAIKNRQLSALDDEIGRKLGDIESAIRSHRPTGRPVDVSFPPWGKLGWSGRRGRHWRLVVVVDEECEDLCDMPRECRAEACLVLGKLIVRLGLSAPLRIRSQKR